MDFSGHEREPGKKLWGIGAVILLHTLIVYSLVTGLARKVVEVVRQPVEAKIIEEAKPPALKETPPKPKLAAPPPPPYIPPPEIRVRTPPPPQKTITNVTTVKPETPVAPPPQPAAPAPPQPVVQAAPPVRTRAHVDASSSCQKPEYPRKSLRLEEQGTVVLQFLIDVNGHVAESKIDKSSGSRDLDNAARNALSLCRFKPATVDGKPEQSWMKMEYVWKIE